MTESCELCGRGYAVGAVAPVWFPYQHVCDRARCRTAVNDAVYAIYDSREQYSELVGAIRNRYQSQGAPVGYRDDALAKMDADGEEWWGLAIVKDTEKP